MDIGIRADGLTTSDFEDFAIEIVKKKFGNNALHGFKEGKDDGIDGIDDIKSPTLIVQAKRWQIDKNRSSAVKLLKEEIEKIANAKLKYEWENKFQYVIVTSMGLSPQGLKEIRDYADIIIPDAMPSDDHFIFASSLKTLSKDISYRKIFEDVGLLEKNIYKVLNATRLEGVESESKDYFTDFNFNYFVETSFLGEAYQILKKEHILLIQGLAGIGKTTTCAMLGNLFLNNSENSFDIIDRKVENIDDTLKLYNECYRDKNGKNLFVVFDDFLGRNKFDVGERILRDVKKLCSAVKNSNNLFICLNTRTQILQSARTVNYEFQKLIDEKFIEERNFIIDLSKYTAIDKAHIFRKTFEKKMSEINESCKVELSNKYNILRRNNWNTIIRHRNYFPRLIELIVNNYASSGEDFYNYVLFFLDHPKNLYDNLFDALELEEKYLLSSLLVFDTRPIESLWLSQSLIKLDLNPTFNFRKSVERLDGSWITFVTKNITDSPKVDFFNPSIIDFLNNRISDEIKKEIFEKSIFLSQLLMRYHSEIDLKTINEKNEVDRGVLFLQDYSENINRSRDKFLKELRLRWDDFKDNSLFIGEKLVNIIEYEEFEEINKEFENYIKDYTGKWNLESQTNGWDIIITKIYYSNNQELKKIFVELMQHSSIVSNILNSEYLTLEIINNIVENLEWIFEEIEYEVEKYSMLNFKDLNFYSNFKNKKIELLQQYIDEYETAADASDNITWDPNGFDLDNEVEGKVYDIIDQMNEDLGSGFIWGDDIKLEHLDYSNLRYNLEEYLQDKFYEYMSNDIEDDYDRLREQQLNSDDNETIEDILNKPLE